MSATLKDLPVAIEAATSFSASAEIAKQVLNTIPLPPGCIGVCDPISNKKANSLPAMSHPFSLFNHTTQLFIDAGYPVFDERPFLSKLASLKETWFIKHSNEHFCKPLIEEFYLPLLETGRVTHLVLLPEWIAQYVSYWEEGYAATHKIKTIQLPDGWDENTAVSDIALFKSQLVAFDVQPKKENDIKEEDTPKPRP